jgi:hypothetical protein
LKTPDGGYPHESGVLIFPAGFIFRKGLNEMPFEGQKKIKKFFKIAFFDLQNQKTGVYYRSSRV